MAKMRMYNIFNMKKNEGISIIVFIFLFFLILNCVFILLKANWVVGDDHVFLASKFKREIALITSSWNGRFVPLAYIDYKLMMFPFRDWALPYYIVSAIKYLLTCGLFILTIKRFNFTFLSELRFNLTQKALAVLLLLFTVHSAPFVDTFFEIARTDQNVLVIMAIFIFMYMKLYLDNSIWIVITLFLLSLAVLLSKEIVFVLIFTFTVSMMLFQWRQFSRIQRLLHVGLLTMCVVYIVYYFFFVFLSADEIFGSDKSVERNIFEVLKTFLLLNPIMALVLLSSTAYFLYKKKFINLSKLDSFVFASLMTSVAVIIFYTRMRFDLPRYYTSIYPFLFICGLYLIHKSESSYGSLRQPIKYLFVVALSLVMLYSTILPAIFWKHFYHKRDNMKNLTEVVKLYNRGYSFYNIIPDQYLAEDYSNGKSSIEQFVEYICEKELFHKCPDFSPLYICDFIQDETQTILNLPHNYNPNELIDYDIKLDYDEWFDNGMNILIYH